MHSWASCLLFLKIIPSPHSNQGVEITRLSWRHCLMASANWPFGENITQECLLNIGPPAPRRPKKRTLHTRFLSLYLSLSLSPSDPVSVSTHRFCNFCYLEFLNGRHFPLFLTLLLLYFAPRIAFPLSNPEEAKATGLLEDTISWILQTSHVAKRQLGVPTDNSDSSTQTSSGSYTPCRPPVSVPVFVSIYVCLFLLLFSSFLMLFRISYCQHFLCSLSRPPPWFSSINFLSTSIPRRRKDKGHLDDLDSWILQNSHFRRKQINICFCKFCLTHKMLTW